MSRVCGKPATVFHMCASGVVVLPVLCEKGRFLARDFAMQLLDLPFITAPLPGIGGRLKVRPELFKVTELMNSRSDAVKEVTQSNGKHAFITLRREGYTTPEIQSALAEAFGLKPEEVGYAGLKDKHAICTQTFSLPRDRIQPVELRKPEGIYGIERVSGRIAVAGCRRPTPSVAPK